MSALKIIKIGKIRFDCVREKKSINLTYIKKSTYLILSIIILFN